MREIEKLLKQLDEKMIQDSAGLNNQHYLTYHLKWGGVNIYFASIGLNGELEFIFDYANIPFEDYETKLIVQKTRRNYISLLELILKSKPFIVDANGVKMNV